MLYVGIDIAKNKHDVACINENGEAVISNFRFDNSYQGFNQLKQKLEQLSPITQDVKIALESTGHLVKSGSSHLRHALIQAAKLLSIYSPHFKCLFKTENQSRKALYCSCDTCSKEFIRLIYHLLTTHQTFEETKVK